MTITYAPREWFIALLVTFSCQANIRFRAADWSAFRGGDGNGIADASESPPRFWGESQNVAWKVDLPGTGAGSPIVVHDHVYLNCAEQLGKRGNRCKFDRDVLWRTGPTGL